MKITLSKSQWELIGQKTGWIKKAQEVIEIDGKKYQEINGDLVEMKEPQKIEQNRKTKEFPSLGVILVEGGEYENWYGMYKILRIVDDKMMEVEYVQSYKPQYVRAGEKKIYPMLGQADIIQGAKKQSEAEISKLVGHNKITEIKKPEEFFTIGYIAKHGYISAEIGPKYHDKFPAYFQKVTGELPNNYLGKGYSLSTNNDRWSYTLRAQMPNPPQEIAQNLKLPDNNIVRKSGIEINDNAYVWGLFNIGFRPGKNDGRIDVIKGKIPADSIDNFMAGFNS